MKDFWNYRAVNKDGVISIYEVFYTEGKPTSVTVDPVSPAGENIEELTRDIIEELYIYQY